MLSSKSVFFSGLAVGALLASALFTALGGLPWQKDARFLSEQRTRLEGIVELTTKAENCLANRMIGPKGPQCETEKFQDKLMAQKMYFPGLDSTIETYVALHEQARGKMADCASEYFKGDQSMENSTVYRKCATAAFDDKRRISQTQAVYDGAKNVMRSLL